MKSKRQILFISATILLLIVIGGWMMVIGRGHTVYFDNKVLEYNGETYEPPYKVTVYVNGEKAAKLKEDERGMATWIGQNFKMELEINWNKDDEDVIEKLSVKLPYNMDGVIIDLAGLLADLPEEAYISEFISTTPEVVEEDVVTDEFGIPEMDMEAGEEVEVPAE